MIISFAVIVESIIIHNNNPQPRNVIFRPLLTQALNNAHNDTVAANKELTSVLDQKLDEYSKKLSDSASYVTQCSNTSFLKNMCLVVLFSAIISGVTSYLVTTKFPRHFNVTGASSVTIYDSNVHVLGGKPVNKEHANNKNQKNN